MAWRRVFRWLALGASAVVVALVATVLFLLLTAPGARFAVGVVLPRLPEAIVLTVAEVDGRLIGPLHLTDVRLEVSGVRIVADTVSVDWRPRAFLDSPRRLALDTVRATGLAVAVDTTTRAEGPTPADTSSDTAGVRLPFLITFDGVVVDGGTVDVPGTVQVDDITFALAGSATAYRAEGRVRVSGPSIPTADVSVAGEGSLESITLDVLRADLLQGSVELDGHLRWLPEVEWDVALDGRGLAYGEVVGDTLAWPGRMDVLGTTAGGLDDYSLEATVSGTGPRLPPSDIRLVGRGSTTAFRFEEATADVLRGRATIAGELQWSPEIVWDVGLALDDIVPAPLFPDSTEWPGSVTLHGRSRGRLLDGEPRLTVVVDTLAGDLRQLPLAGYLAGEVRGRAVTVDTSWVRWGAARVFAVGQFAGADRVAGRFALDVPDLSALHPDWTGVLSGSGTAGRHDGVVHVEADLRADGLSLDSLRVSRAAGRLSLEIDSVPAGSIDLALDSLVLGQLVVDSATLRTAGALPDHTIDLQVDAPKASLGLAAAGGIDGRTWDGTVAEFVVVQTDVGRWEMLHPSLVAASDSAIRVDSLCLTGAASSLCVAGTWHRTAPWNARADVTALPLAVLDPFLPEGITVSGAVDGTLRAAAGAGGRLDAEVALTLGPGEIGYPVGNQERTMLYRPVELRSVLDSTGWTAATSVVLALPSGEEFATIEADGALPEYREMGDSLPGQPLSGHLVARFDDVSLIRALDPSIAAATGRVRADLTFSGVVGEIHTEGEARFEDGRVTVPDLGIVLEDIQVTATGDETRGLRVEGRARSGEGDLTVVGTSPLVPSPSDPATLTITGERFQAVRIPEANVVVSPDLTMRMTRDSVDLSGTITMPTARIELTEVPANAVAVSDDVVFVDVDADSLEGSSPVTVTSSVQVVLGDSVSFRGFGFRADLDGAFRLEDRPNQATTGSGTITITRGRYRAQGQDLRIEDGRVIFNGPVDDPALDIRAFREARDRTIAGLDIRGTLQNPQVTVFSIPAMSQSEAMSYIMFGRPLDRGNSAEQNRMADAAAAVGGDMLAQSLGGRVGLEAGIEQGTAANEAAFVAGTYLSPQLFVAYGVGLFDRINIFRVRYEFTRRWSVQAESSRESSADVFFTFERK